MRYRVRPAYKVTRAKFEKMQKLRAEGKPYSVVGPLCGVSPDCARKWLQGRTPKQREAR